MPLTWGEQNEFTLIVEAAIDEQMARLRQLWRAKPKIRNYREPYVEQELIRVNLGIAAFVTSEQIDERGLDNPQMRYELFLVRHGHNETLRIHEDHAYAREQVECYIRIISLEPGEIIISNRGGTKKLKF